MIAIIFVVRKRKGSRPARFAGAHVFCPGVVGTHGPRHVHAKKLLQPMPAIQSLPPGGRHAKSLLPEGPEGNPQETICCFQRGDSRQTHFLH